MKRKHLVKETAWSQPGEKMKSKQDNKIKNTAQNMQATNKLNELFGNFEEEEEDEDEKEKEIEGLFSNEDDEDEDGSENEEITEEDLMKKAEELKKRLEEQSNTAETLQQDLKEMNSTIQKYQEDSDDHEEQLDKVENGDRYLEDKDSLVFHGVEMDIMEEASELDDDDIKKNFLDQKIRSLLLEKWDIDTTASFKHVFRQDCKMMKYDYNNFFPGGKEDQNVEDGTPFSSFSLKRVKKTNCGPN